MNGIMEKIRSFIAIELPQELKLALSRLQEKLKSTCSVPVRWVDPGNIHLTLKFLGDISPDITSRITSALENAAQGTHPFSIEASGLGVFPNMERIQIIWVGLAGELERLGQLQKRIEACLIPLGFPSETKPFTPHLTLARVRDYARRDERLALGEIIAGMSFEQRYKINVNAILLIKSQLTREGPIYTRISTIVLK